MSTSLDIVWTNENLVFFKCQQGSFAQKAYKWFYLLSNQTNWTRKAFLLHKVVILRLMEDFAIKKLDLLWWKLARDWEPDLLWWKLAKEGSKTLQVTPAFPNWIISNKRLPAPSRSGSSRISNCQPLLETHISCSSMFLLLRIKVSTEKSKDKFLVSFIKMKDK